MSSYLKAIRVFSLQMQPVSLSSIMIIMNFALSIEENLAFTHAVKGIRSFAAVVPYKLIISSLFYIIHVTIHSKQQRPYQPARMCRLVCAFAFCMSQSVGFPVQCSVSPLLMSEVPRLHYNFSCLEDQTNTIEKHNYLTIKQLLFHPSWHGINYIIFFLMQRFCFASLELKAWRTCKSSH